MDTLLLILNFFVLSNFVLARITVIGPNQPVIAAVGENAILPCHFSYPEKLTEVRYFRFKDGRRLLINHFQDGKDQQNCELQEYIGRTELMNKNIAHGRTALKLLNVSVSDEGTYRCYLQTRTNFDSAIFELRVKALGSNPWIEIESFQDDKMLAVCRSNGWYPKPTVLDRDDDGKAVALNASGIIVRQQDNLFSVVYHRIILEASNRTFSCLLRTPYHPDMISSLYVADRVFKKVPSPGSNLLWIWPVCFTLLVLVAVGGAFFYLKRCRKNKADLRSNFNKLPSEEETAETGSSGAPEREPLKTEELKMKRSLKRLSWCMESKITDGDAAPEGDLERELLKNEEEQIKATTDPTQRKKLTLEKHKAQWKKLILENYKDDILTMLMEDHASLSKAVQELLKKQKEKYERDLDVVIQEKECLKKERDAFYVELEMFKMEKRQGKILIPRAQSSRKSCAKPPPGNTTELKPDSPPETAHAHLQLTDDQKDIKD